MLRRTAFTILLILTLTAGAFAADDLKSAFKEGKLYGNFRAYHFTRDFDVITTREDIAAGGMLYYRTAPLYGVNVGIAFYTSQGMGLNDDDKDVYGLLAADANGDHESYSVLGESFIQFARWDSTFKAGRQELETPWVNKWDIRLTPQSTAILAYGEVGDQNINYPWGHVASDILPSTEDYGFILGQSEGASRDK